MQGKSADSLKEYMGQWVAVYRSSVEHFVRGYKSAVYENDSSKATGDPAPPTALPDASPQAPAEDPSRYCGLGTWEMDYPKWDIVS